jgi:hypothetical protein
MSSQNYAEVFKVAMEYENFNGFEVGFAIGEGQPN